MSTAQLNRMAPCLAAGLRRPGSFSMGATSLAPPIGAAGSADSYEPEKIDARERFLPIARSALIERLTQSDAWSVGTTSEARRFFRYLEHWRRQQYNAALLDLEQCYEPFSPDTDLLVTSTFTAAERMLMQNRVVSHIEQLLQQANYVRIDPAQVEMIIT